MIGDCACTNEHIMLIDTPNTENGEKCHVYGILREFEVGEDCENCYAMEQSGYIIANHHTKYRSCETAVLRMRR